MGCEKNNQPSNTVKKVQSVEVKKEETEERFGKIYAKGSKLPYSGKIISFYASGEKKSEEEYRNGEPHGLTVYWNKDGTFRQKSNFNEGKLHGLNVMWVNGGQKLFEINSNNGRRDGLNTQWYYNGQKRTEENFKNGKKNGLFTVWHENGQKKYEVKWQEDEKIESSEKFWNNRGEAVTSMDESLRQRNFHSSFWW